MPFPASCSDVLAHSVLCLCPFYFLFEKMWFFLLKEKNALSPFTGIGKANQPQTQTRVWENLPRYILIEGSSDKFECVVVVVVVIKVTANIFSTNYATSPVIRIVIHALV